MTDRAAAPGGDVVAQIARARAGGSFLVQVREKDLGGRDLLELVRAVVATGVRVLVNDRIDVALAAGAHGVHLPGGGMSIADARALLGAGKIIGVSTHSVAEAEAAARAGADLIALGPIWETPSKMAYGAPLGAQAIRDASTRCAGAALFAIGGVDGRARAAEARAAGAHGVAVIRAIMAAADPAAAVRELAP